VILRARQCFEYLHVTSDECVFLRSRPTLELGFTRSGLREVIEALDAEQTLGRIQGRGPASSPCCMIFKPLEQIQRGSDIDGPRPKAQKINNRPAPRQAWDHSPRFGNQEVHIIRVCRPQTMSLLVFEKALEPTNALRRRPLAFAQGHSPRGIKDFVNLRLDEHRHAG